MGRLPAPEQLLVAAVDMGYGHIRAAHALAKACGVPVNLVDRFPFASPREEQLWNHLRLAYTALSRASQRGGAGRALRLLLEIITDIPHLYPYRDLSSPTLGVKFLQQLTKKGLGANLVAQLQAHQQSLLATFFAPAIAAATAGCTRVVCVVTDSDINRIWVPADPRAFPIHYCAPSERAARRLLAYGVPPHRVHLTGFPLPEELTLPGNPEEATQRFARRLARLDPKGTFRRQLGDAVGTSDHTCTSVEDPPRLTFAVGGAGAQAGIARAAIPSLAPAVRAGRLRLTLVAGVHAHLAELFRGWLAAAQLSDLPEESVAVLYEPSWEAYLERFNATLLDTDILWTKPSELTFYGALGLALVLAPPVGVHEVLNRRWAMERGAALKQEAAHAAGQWILDWLDEGLLAGAAWNGFHRLPREGTSRILELAANLQAEG